MDMDDFDEKIAWLSDEKKKKMPLIKNIYIKNCEETISDVESEKRKLHRKKKKFLPKKFITQHMHTYVSIRTLGVF